MVLNVFRQGYQCIRCHQAAHSGCLEAAEQTPCCPETLGADPTVETLVVAAEAETHDDRADDTPEAATVPPESSEPHEHNETPEIHESQKSPEPPEPQESSEVPESQEPQESTVPSGPQEPQEPQEPQSQPPEEQKEEMQTPGGEEVPPPKALVVARSPSPAEADREQERARHRELAVRELIETEQQYHGDLMFIESVFYHPLENDPQVSQLITPADFRSIFSNFAVLRPLHSELLWFVSSPSLHMHTHTQTHLVFHL